MAKEILVGEQLTDGMLQAGRQLLADIKQPLEVIAAFWLLIPEAGEWRLAVVSPRVDTDGSRELYSSLWDRLYSGKDRAKVYGLELYNITALSPHDKLVAALVGANSSYRQSVGRDLAEQRLQDIYLNGTFVPDLYLYFIDDALRAPRGSEWVV
jgi:hypothetical protein